MRHERYLSEDRDPSAAEGSPFPAESPPLECASTIIRSSVVPDRGTPTMTGIGAHCVSMILNGFREEPGGGSGGCMKRLDALKAIYEQLQSRTVVTIMGAVAAELQSIGHRPNFFYLQHAMGLASSMGLGIALVRAGSTSRRARRRRLGPHESRRSDDAGAISSAQSGSHRLRQREPAVGGRISDCHVDGQRHRRGLRKPPAFPARPPFARLPSSRARSMRRSPRRT